MINLKGRDVLNTNEWAKEELDQVLDLAFKFKAMGEKAKSLEILKGKTLLLLFSVVQPEQGFLSPSLWSS